MKFPIRPQNWSVRTLKTKFLRDSNLQHHYKEGPHSGNLISWKSNEIKILQAVLYVSSDIKSCFYKKIHTWQYCVVKPTQDDFHRFFTYSAFRLEVAQSAAGPDLAFHAFLHYTLVCKAMVEILVNFVA